MNLLEMILNSKDGGSVKQMARNLGIGEDDAKSAVTKMLPALSRGIQNNISREKGPEELLNALNKGNHQRYMDNPEELDSEDTIRDGNSILGHILGSKDVSRRVADNAAQQTGLDSGILKKMLPMIASLAMGSLGKQASSTGMLGSAQGSGQSTSPLVGMLSSFLDADKDGSVIDDLLGIAKKFF